ncbi:MAG: hypothetical protein Tsb0013_19490 [Phycisphaerales bacterium]
MSDQAVIESLEQQLCALYQEREQLSSAIGANCADDVINMISSLEAQLHDFYNRFGSNPGFDDAETMQVLSKIKELSDTLDPLYSKKSVQFFIENDKPVLRAEWTEALNQGDD